MLNKVYYFKVYGLSEDIIKQRLNHYNDQQLVDLKAGTDVTTDTLITLTFPPQTKQLIIDAVFNDIYTIFGDNVYADNNVTIAHQLVMLCCLRKLKLSVAESITGGAIASEIVAIDGASKMLVEGIVCYDNLSKINRLGVRPAVIDEHGAVSHDTAYEMALGLLSTKLCDVCIATTGIAGPSGGTPTKPVGLCYMAIGDSSAVHVHKSIYSGTRNQIRQKATQDALFYMYQRIKKIG